LTLEVLIFLLALFDLF